MKKTYRIAPLATLIIAVPALITASGCAWVKAKPSAQHVVLASADAAAGCKKLSMTTSKTLSNIAGIARNTEKQGVELANLARNQAAVLGGDTIVAESPRLAGEQTFGIYRCNGGD